MTRISESYVLDRDLIVVRAVVTGPTATLRARLVLDTGAAATTLTREFAKQLGYSRGHGYRTTKVHTAVGEEFGYWLRVQELTALGVATDNFALAVFPLGHDSLDGLLGMNFLRYFNFEIRPDEKRIVAELIH